ncbi:hypothetical protein CISIN_1g039764mg, partial [Citrus sinensis]
CMKTLKGYIRNHARLEGCIAECCLAEECVRFCSGYIDEIIIGGRLILKGRPLKMSEAMIKIAHRYVLLNTIEAEPFREMHMEELQRSFRRRRSDIQELHKMHTETFSQWLAEKVS